MRMSRSICHILAGGNTCTFSFGAVPAQICTYTHSLTPQHNHWLRHAGVSHQPVPTNGAGPDSLLTMSTSASRPMPAGLDTAMPVLASSQPASNLKEASSYAASSLGEASCYPAIHLEEESVHPASHLEEALLAHDAQASQPDPIHFAASTTTAEPPVVTQLSGAQKELNTDSEAVLGIAAGAQSNSSHHLAGASEDEVNAQAPPVLVPSVAAHKPVTISQSLLEDHAVLSTPLLTGPQREAESLDEDERENTLLDEIRQRQEVFKARVQARLLAQPQPWWQRFLADYQVRKLTILDNECCHCLAAVLSQLSGMQAYHCGEQCCCLSVMQFLSNKRIAPWSGSSQVSGMTADQSGGILPLLSSDADFEQQVHFTLERFLAIYQVCKLTVLGNNAAACQRCSF